MNKPIKILVIAFKFPPYDGIGARRWAKFAKYFAQSNQELHVVTTNWYSTGRLGWEKDIQDQKIKIHQLANPVYWLQNKLPSLFGLIEKITLSIRFKVLKQYDEAHFWTAISKSKIKKIIVENNITHAIATGPPFSVNMMLAKLKSELPNVKIIQDLRDPWIDDPYYLQRAPKAETQKQDEINMLNGSDAIVSATGSLLDLYKNKCTNGKVKFELIFNGFDAADANKNAKPSDKIKFEKEYINISYFGTIGAGREHQLMKFAIALNKQPMEVYEKFRINIFGAIENEVDEKIKKLPIVSIFNFNPFMSINEVQYYMQASQIHLSINSEIYPYAFGTKLYDAFLYRKKVMLISPEGELYSLLKENNLGYVTDGSSEKTSEIIQQIILDSERQKSNEEITNEFNFDKFSIQNLTQEYIQFLEQV